MKDQAKLPRVEDVEEKKARWSKIHLFAGGFLFTGFAQILTKKGVVEKLFATGDPDSLILGAAFITGILFLAGYWLTKLVFLKVEGLRVSVKIIKQLKIGWVIFVLIAYGMLNVFVSMENVTEAKAEKRYGHSMAAQPSPAEPCDVLRYCAFSKYAYLDDGISAAPVIADAIIASCRNDYEVCANSILFEAGADLELVQDGEMREAVLQKVKRDWIIPMILAARVREK